MNVEALLRLFPKSLLKDQVQFFDEAFSFADLNTKQRQAMFFTQTAHETMNFVRLRENLNYGAQGLAETWPAIYAIEPNAKTKKPNELALEIQRKPELIANHSYANKLGNGDVKSGEGWKYRGAGDMMITGVDNFEDVDNDFHMNGKIVSMPEMLTEPYWAIMSAASFWRRNKLNSPSDKKDLAGARRIINGRAMKGLKETVTLWSKIYPIL